MDNSMVMPALVLLVVLSVLNMAAIVLHQLTLNSFERSNKRLEELVLLCHKRVDEISGFASRSSQRVQEQLVLFMRMISQSEEAKKALDKIDTKEDV